jgi:cob(I)alamin adenosyltransferase
MLRSSKSMPKITKVYTRAGDDGTTSLGGGQRIPKDALRVSVYGTVDELNSQIGAALAAGVDKTLVEDLRRIQNELFHLGSDLCVLEEDKERMPVPRVEKRHVDALEELMDRLSAELQPLENFVLPGGAPAAVQLHVARTVCRRAERQLVALAAEEAVGEQTVPYLNRLSDALFVMARFENNRQGVPDVIWDSRA